MTIETLDTLAGEEHSKLEEARDKFGAALHSIFIAYGSGEEDRNIVSFSDNPRLAEQAIYDLFDAGAEIKRLEAEEKLKTVKPYSDEALAIQKEADRYTVAADYIKGHRTQEKSRQDALSVYEEYLNIATHEVNEFLSMKEGNVARSGFLHLKRDEVGKAAYKREEESYYRQIDFANDYIRRNYNLNYLPTERDKDKTVEQLRKSVEYNPVTRTREKN